jgi:hypothetical protein
MNKELQYFFENTKQLHILLSIALLLIIIIMVAPIGKGFMRYSGQVVIVIILIYILFKNFIETHNFALVQKEMEKDRLKKKDKKDEEDEEDDIITDGNMLDIKNNTLASYVLCGFIMILLVYVIYSIFV